jgi:hypothetical protein
MDQKEYNRKYYQANRDRLLKRAKYWQEKYKNKPRDMERTLATDKRCPKCKKTKKGSEFYRCKSTADGLGDYCKECRKKIDKEYRQQPQVRKRLLADKRKYSKTPKARIQRKAYSKQWREREENADKIRAHRLVYKALARGEIEKGPCEKEGSECRGLVTAHHDDHTKPLEVRWLCRYHHYQIHLGEGK